MPEAVIEVAETQPCMVTIGNASRVPAAAARRAAVELAQEVGKAVAHLALAFLELQAGG
ncbi:MAG TPA: hypothetical protein VHB47_09815 [Thermoanaerobaculia bacterium]|nr:hypothetical protein [Thermoanaerobaculia bacterium]